nr:putative coat protein [Dichroa partitivirus 2]
MGERITPTDDITPVGTPTPPALGLTRTSITRVSDFLQDNSRLNMVRSHYDKHRRYATLHIQQMFNSLVALYSSLFLTRWPDFKRFMDQFNVPATIHPWTYAARAYLSAWIHDLYVSNREAVKKLSPLAFSQHFQHEEVYYLHEYDEFLVRLNASIRPTHIKGIMEDTLYIPLIHENPTWDNNVSPFAIVNFNLSFDLVNGLIGIMKDRKGWKISSLVTDTLGRPSWLFDWHSDNRCCAWFPPEGNYTMDDVSIAYIIGVACTPKLGPRDIDDWQLFENNIVPNPLIADNLERAVERRFFGGYEVRTLEQRQVILGTCEAADPEAQPGSKRVRTGAAKKASKSITTGAEPLDGTTSGAQDEEVIQLIPQFQLTDWTYYHLVIQYLDNHTRSGALKMLAQD